MGRRAHAAFHARFALDLAARAITALALATLLSVPLAHGAQAAAGAGDSADSTAPITESPGPPEQPEPQDAGPITWGVVPTPSDESQPRSRFEPIIKPGSQTLDSVAVINYSPDELTLDLYARDAFTTPSGGLDIQPSAQTPQHAGSWISFDVETVTIPPRSRMEVPFRILVPEAATPGDHAAGIVATHTSESVDDEGNTVATENRVGARVYVRVTGELHPKLEVTLLDATYGNQLNPLSRGTTEFTYRVTNTGNVRLAARPTIGTTWFFGFGSHRVEAQDLPELLPGESFTASGMLPKTAPLGWLRGAVQVEPLRAQPMDGLASDPAATLLDDADLAPVTDTHGIWAIPWVALLLLTITGRLVWRWRQRRRAAKTGDTKDTGTEPTSSSSDATDGDSTDGNPTDEETRDAPEAALDSGALERNSAQQPTRDEQRDTQ